MPRPNPETAAELARAQKYRDSMKLPPAAIAALTMLLPAAARESSQWADSPAAVRQWFQSLMQPDNPSVSCCGEADAFEADTFEVEGDHYVAVITDGKGMIAPGTRIPVPNRKMKWDAGNPTGHGILFLQVGTMNVYCYVAPGGV
jgi:hypothetical protein